jgi:hypothetical protein
VSDMCYKQTELGLGQVTHQLLQQLFQLLSNGCHELIVLTAAVLHVCFTTVCSKCTEAVSSCCCPILIICTYKMGKSSTARVESCC